jgi:phage FluMu protein Com
MAEDRLKFRCYRCNQLLAVQARKAGSIVACPKCKAELEVPRPEAEPARTGAGGIDKSVASRTAPVERPDNETPSAQPSPLPSFMEQIAAAIPEDLAGLRPEDIRVEAEFADLVVTTQEPSPAEPAPELRNQGSNPPETSPVTVLPTREVPPSPKESIPTLDAVNATVLPEINIEPATILPPGREMRPVHEVVLQPATVLAWSLLVLFSLPMAFIAGLLIGHFIWR